MFRRRCRSRMTTNRNTMVKISIDYEGGLHCVATHGPSGDRLATDAPVDNEGKGEAFSPTDLVAAALGACIATTMAIVAGRKGIELSGSSVDVGKEMSAEPPRKISRLKVKVVVPLAADHPVREVLEAAARRCPVARSLDPGVDVPLEFVWSG